MGIPKWLCRVLTLGRHWYQYYPVQVGFVHCRLCGQHHANMWKKFAEMRNSKYNSKKWINERRTKCGRLPFP